RHIDRPVRLLSEDAVLAEELDGPVARSMDADLAVPHDPETILEPYLRSRVEAEQVGRESTEIAAQGPREPVRHTKGAFELRQAQRRRQTDDREVRFRRIDHTVIVGLWELTRLCGWGLLACLVVGRPGRWSRCDPEQRHQCDRERGLCGSFHGGRVSSNVDVNERSGAIRSLTWRRR